MFSWQTELPVLQCEAWLHKQSETKLSFITVPRGDSSSCHTNEGFPYFFPISFVSLCLFLYAGVSLSGPSFALSQCHALPIPHNVTMQYISKAWCHSNIQSHFSFKWLAVITIGKRLSFIAKVAVLWRYHKASLGRGCGGYLGERRLFPHL